MKLLKQSALLLSWIACLNYGILGVFDFDVLQHALINFPVLHRILYFFIGLAAFINLLEKKEK